MRRIQLTSTLIEQIALDVRAGNFIEPAARRHGVGHSTLHKWLSRGRDLARAVDRDDEDAGASEWTERDRLCVDLVDTLEKAEAEAEVRVVAIVQNAIPTNWQAGFRWLESRARSRWLRVERQELTGRDGGPVEVEDPTERIIAETDRIAARLLETGVRPLAEAEGERR
ncbi:MAG: hypothetical protein ACRDM0_00330 [Thermoleophilaceae bacterium]